MIGEMKKRYMVLVAVLLVCRFTAGSQEIAVDREKLWSSSGVESECFENSLPIDVTKALYGKIAGLNVYQGTGASPDNIASLSFHGHAPLVLVDGFPRSLSDLTSLEIESCYLLKDATASALYGVRGANGVLLVKTKRGQAGKLNIGITYNMGISTQFRAPEFSDSYTYANALNTALLGDGHEPRYNDDELDAFRTGKYPYDYPDVDWWKETMNDIGMTHNLKMSFNGGNERFRYYTVIDYYRDRSMLQENTEDDRYNTNPTDTRLSLRANIDVDVTRTTYLAVGVTGRLDETNGTRFGRAAIFNQIYGIPSAAFPVRYLNGVWGGNATYNANNPVALLKDYGHQRIMTGGVYADMKLTQKLDALTEGLSANVSVSFDNVGSMTETSSKEYVYMNSYPEIVNGFLVTSPVYYGKDSETLGHGQSFRSLALNLDFQVSVDYKRSFGKHGVGVSAMFDLQQVTTNGRNTSRKNMSYILNAGYDYAGKYIVNAVVSHSGSAYLPVGDKFRTYPAVSAAWVMSEESFLSDVEGVDMLKIKASYGLSGWDGSLSHEMWMQSYGASNTGYNFGSNAAPVYGNSEGALPVVGLTPEKSEKATFGIDFRGLENRLGITVEGFYEKRSDILVDASNRISGIIGISVGKLCEGINEYRGSDIAINWRDKLSDFSYGISATASYLNTKVIEDNQAYQEYDYLYRKGNPVNQMYGLEAIGFFNSQLEINNSPVQTFSDVAPGDVKYKDQNGDNVIDSKDIVKMYGSSLPEFYFGFSLEFGYKNFNVTADFQGLAGKTVNLLNSPLYKPLVNNGNISDTFLDNEICWTPATKDSATMPRLTTMENANNYQASSLWYRDGSFLKLRNLMVSYTFRKELTKFADVKLYLAGNNLFSWDSLGTLDPEQLGIAYPSVRTFWFGVKFSF